MRRAIAALAVVGFIAACTPPRETIDNTYGNTLVAELPDGGVVRYFFNEDRTYSVTAPGGESFSGTYTISDDGQVCTTSDGGTFCSRYPTDKDVGDTWTQVRADGGTLRLTLQAGR